MGTGCSLQPDPGQEMLRLWPAHWGATTGFCYPCCELLFHTKPGGKPAPLASENHSELWQKILFGPALEENIQDNGKENSVLLRGARLHSKRRFFDISIPVHVDREYISVVQAGETRTRQMLISNRRSSTSLWMPGTQLLETCPIGSTSG